MNPRPVQTPLPVRLLWYLLLTLLAACGDLPLLQPERQAGDARALQAEQLYATGRYREAADVYLELSASANTRDTAADYRLDAVQAVLAAGDKRAARKLLAATRVASLSPAVRGRKAIVTARLALAEHQPKAALSALSAVDSEQLPPRLRQDAWRLRSDAYAQTGNYIEAARARVHLELELADPAETEENRQFIWDMLNRLSPMVLEQAGLPPPDTLGGWMELAAIAKRHGTDVKSLSLAIETWRGRYPGHPANPGVVPELLESSRLEVTHPGQIALLLPQEGAFARAGAAVRDGFFAAWYADPSPGPRPHLRVYAATPADLWPVYQQAVDEGAQFIVGPLDKESVALLANSERLPVPTLALNQVEPAGTETPGGEPQAVTEGLYQFGLSPEAEARQVAQRAWFDGHTRALVIYPESSWGQRVAEAFNQAWREAGGVVTAQQGFAATGQDISDAITRLLNIDRSEARVRALKHQLGLKIEAEPRRRQDTDFVFMAGFPGQARQLRPQLRFHHAADLPVYATSHIYAGVSNPQQDRDINGVLFGDMPWVVMPNQTRAALQQRIRATWPERVTAFNRLFALGVDAYELIPYLQRMRAHRYTQFQGATGRLQLDASNRVQRALVWARMRAGRAQALGADASPSL